MNVKPKKYAQALADIVSQKNPDEKKISANFLTLLEKHQDVKKAREILALTEELLLKKTGNKKVILETARNVDVKDFTRAFVKKGDIIEEKINPGIIAGIKIKVDGDRQLDLSLLKKLNNIFQ